MTLALLAFLGGVLTILSPCILPVLPFVFARSGQPFARSTLPLLIGMALTFAALATLAAVGGAWAVRFNDYGRWLALAILTVSAAALLSRRIADWITRPFVALGDRLLARKPAETGIAPSLLLGVATGFVWAPCAGPILGLILTGAALHGPSTTTTLLLLAYALGAALSLAVAATAGNRLFALLKRSFGAGEWLRRALGVAVLAGVASIALGWDTGILTRLSVGGTNQTEQRLLDRLGGAAGGNVAAMSGASATSDAMGADMSAHNSDNMMMTAATAPGGSTVEGHLPSLAGATGWLNSAPLTPAALRGKVVLIDFWTYSCINCLRALPYVKSWYARYAPYGLVVIGVHAPEFPFEKNPDNVRRAVHDLGITYPVALDNDYAIWGAFNNRYWPAHYFIDAQGQIRGHHFGEGDYAASEQLIRKLLLEAGATQLPPPGAGVEASGAEAPADEAQLHSPETYVGYARAENFSSPGGAVRDARHDYSAPATLTLNQWALIGPWRIEADRAVALGPNAAIRFRFHARDLHLVLGAPDAAHPLRFRVSLDGQAPGEDHGSDVQPDGTGTVSGQRLYQLIRQAQPQGEHTFTIEFPDAGVQAYSFTFG
jgi:cytochrome c biogenesis protein CcdA/thiol-disulfide isomerase/thioredoxin